jgi:hypothetical protein
MMTVTERQQHSELLAMDMHIRHYKRVKQSREKPSFFIDHVQSKINELAARNKTTEIPVPGK